LIYIYINIFDLVCDKGLAGPNCSLLCDCEFGVCNISATSESNKCICATGYTGYKCDQSINFCASSKLLKFLFLIYQFFFVLASNYCNTTITNRICLNAPTNSDQDTSRNATGYVCLCENGYQPGPGSVCQDINECALASSEENICPAQTTTCVDYAGGYRCDCLPGYTKDGASVNINNFNCIKD
jgi:Notch-like protein